MVTWVYMNVKIYQIAQLNAQFILCQYIYFVSIYYTLIMPFNKEREREKAAGQSSQDLGTNDKRRIMERSLEAQSWGKVEAGSQVHILASTGLHAVGRWPASVWLHPGHG